MATIYRYTDSGAPTKPANGNYNGASWFMSIVKACLVTGYGSKAGAGWTIVYEDTTANARRMALTNGNGVIEFVTWGTVSVAVFIWDSITAAGTGRIYDTAWATAVSTGVNGWGAQNAKLPAASPINVMGFNFQSMMSDALNSQWTVTADDKSAWIDFHYALTSTSAEKGDPASVSISYHPKLFFGAVNSPDLASDQFGNFFALYDGHSLASSNAATGASTQLSRLISLRTPLNLVPSTNLEFDCVRQASQPGSNLYNINDSVRVILPLMVVYKGGDRPAPVGMNSSFSNYCFATIPGIGCMAPSGTIDFWQYYSAQYATASNLEIFDINGIDWTPLQYYGTNSNSGVTTSVEWWSA